MGKTIEPTLLICPHCKSKIKMNNSEKFVCINCHTEYFHENNRIIFKKFEQEDIIDELDKFKSFFKNWSKLYDLLIKILSPVLVQTKLKKFIKTNVTDKTVAINLGSGNSNISEKITNVDIFPYENVNLCCDINNIPLEEASADIVINIAVLEHVTNPENVINEIFRILKPGGIVYTYFPFMQPYHASPYDFSRRTIEGLRILHNMFEIKELKIGSGPTSGFLWVFQEWLAIIFSFGIKKIHHFVYLLIMVFTFPLKYLDLILSKFNTSQNISSAFIVIAQKK